MLRVDTGEESYLPGIEGPSLLGDFTDEMEINEQLAKVNAELSRF